MTGTIHGILVGYDGSAGSELALAWAGREARSRGTIVTVCHAWTPGYFAGLPGDNGAADRAQRASEQNPAQALRFTRNIMGPGRAQPLLAAGPAASVLCEYGAAADMVVLGAGGGAGCPGEERHQGPPAFSSCLSSLCGRPGQRRLSRYVRFTGADR